MPVEEFKAAWTAMDVDGYEAGVKTVSPEVPYMSQGRDLVSQMIVGLGFRVTGMCDGVNTLSYLVTSPDPNGVQFVASAKKESSSGADELTHFDASRLDAFFGAHSQRQGISLLAFKADDVDAIFKNYKIKHASLLPPSGVRTYGGCKVLEVRASERVCTGSTTYAAGTNLRRRF